jgi:hypothetical protein
MTVSAVQVHSACATLCPGVGRVSKGTGPDSLVAPGSVPAGPSHSKPSRVAEFYTHALHAARCVDYAQACFRDPSLGDGVLKAFVQVKLGHQIFCGRIVRPWLTNEGFSMWKLQLATPGGQLVDASVPAFKVRQCSGVDGACPCAREVRRERPQAAPSDREGVTCQ